MSNIQVHRINACKFDYEYLGRSTAELALTYSFPEDLIKEEIQLKGWTRKIAPTELPDTSDIQKFATALESTARAKLNIISLFRQIDNQPMIAQLEKTFLEKALHLAEDLNAIDDKAANKLVNLVKAVAQIQDRNPIDLADQLKEMTAGGAGGQVIVNIANQIQ